MRTIAIEGMLLHAPTGHYRAEQILGNDLEVSIQLNVQVMEQTHADELSYTIDYEAVYQQVHTILQEPAKLLETAVTRIIECIAKDYPSVEKLKVKVAKLNPPVSGIIKKVWVEEAWVRNSEKQA